jgi:hypothetical protein
VPKGELFKSTQSVTIDGMTPSLATETGTVQLRDENDVLFGFTHFKNEDSHEN